MDSASSHKLQLTIAVLVGASVVAASAYYMHCRDVVQLSGNIVRSSTIIAKSVLHHDTAGRKPPPLCHASAGTLLFFSVRSARLLIIIFAQSFFS
jgi:hypothetical protein